MRKILTLFLMILLAENISAQSKAAVEAVQQMDPSFSPAFHAPDPVFSPLLISGYYTQGFEAAAFPPAGCQVYNVSGPTYAWARSTTQAHLSTASAFIRYDAATGEDWLVMPKFLVAGTDSISFYLRLAFQGYAPDSLSIKVSTTDSATSSFTTTILSLKEGINYPPNSTAWYRYSVSLAAYAGQQIYIAFKHNNVNGDGLYIDDVAIGTEPANEVMTSSIIVNSTVLAGTVTTPQASFSNTGSATQTFNVTMDISGGYTSTQTVTALAPGAATTVSFDPWTPAAGVYTVTAYTQLAGDADLSNDTLSKSVSALSTFPNGGWNDHTALPAGRWATAPVFAKPCLSGTDTGFVYLIAGSDGAFANTTLNSAFNLVTNTWSNKAPIPTSRMQITPLSVDGKIYVIGGYTGSFSPVSTNSIYDIATDTWSTGAAMPTAVGDYAAFVYSDSLIYIIGGYNGTGDVNTVQLYNINTNTWTTATGKPGAAVAGGRASASGNTIIFAGGYSQTMALTLSAAYKGVIDLTDPSIITWSTIAAYPGGPAGRLAAGVTAQSNGYVYFGGGDPNGAGTTTSNQVYAYNTVADLWETGPNMNTGVSNINGFAGIIDQDTLYLATMGGYDGAAVVSAHSWLKIGPASIPSVSPGTSVCEGFATMLTASNGTSYSWSPAASLDNASVATPIAMPAFTTTYTVTITQKIGCPVEKNVTVVVNMLPTANAGTDLSVCEGSTIPLNASGGILYTWLPSAVLDNASISSPNATPSGTTTFTVTVTDLNGCIDTDEITVTVNPLPALSITGSNVSCNGSANGSGTVSVTGSAYFYSWTSGDTTATAAGLAPGTYTVTVTDTLSSCFSDGTITITEPLALMLSTTNDTTSVCDGVVNVAVSGGTPGYSYLWNDPMAQTGDTATALCPGTYTVQVTDNNGCVATITAEVATGTGIESNGTAEPAFYPNPVNDQLTVIVNTASGNAWVVLTDVLGKELKRVNTSLFNGAYGTLNMSDLQPGVYLLQLHDGSIHTLGKVIKK